MVIQLISKISHARMTRYEELNEDSQLYNGMSHSLGLHQLISVIFSMTNEAKNN